MSKIQNDGFKSVSDLVASGLTEAQAKEQMLSPDKVFLTTQNKLLSEAIADGSLGGGGGSGQGGINYLGDNGDADKGIGDWTVGNGNIEVNEIDPLRGDADFKVSMPAITGAICQVPFTIDKADLGKPLYITFDFDITGVVTSIYGLSIEIIKTSNSEVVNVTNASFDSKTSGSHIALFYSSINVRDYSLVIRRDQVTDGGTPPPPNAIEFFIDNIIVGPKEITKSTGVISYTFLFDNSLTVIDSQNEGSLLQSVTNPSTGVYRAYYNRALFPNGPIIKETLRVEDGSGPSGIRLAGEGSDATGDYVAVQTLNSSGAGSNLTGTDTIEITLTQRIEDQTAYQISTDLGNREIYFEGGAPDSSGGVYAANTPFRWTPQIDTIGMYDFSIGAWTIQETGVYNFQGIQRTTGSVGRTFYLRVNRQGTIIEKVMGSANGQSVFDLDAQLKLIRGDVVDIRSEQTWGVYTTDADRWSNISVTKQGNDAPFLAPLETTIISGGEDARSLGIDNTGGVDVTSDIETLLLTRDSLYFPDGLYQVGDLEITNKKIHGTGTFVKNIDAERCFILNSNCEINGVGFNSLVNGVQRADIKLNDGAQDVLITGCRFESVALYAAISADLNGGDDSLLTYTNPASGIIISNNRFKGYIRPLYLHSVQNLTITNNTFRDCLRDAIRLRQNTGMCNISGNVFKDIGESSSAIAERPANWISLDSYVAGQRVSVPPFGIYEANKTTTIGENPATAGAADWDLVDGSYFETKDAVDTYWGGSQLVISNNVIDGTASVGLDIKGTEPSGLYSTDSVIITGNIIKNTFGIGLNFHSSALLEVGPQTGEFRYVGNAIISNNIFRGCNAERYDVAQPAINIRQGTSNVTISNNHIKNHYGRGINILNLDGNSKINRSCKVTGNQIIDCGLPGHAGNIGLNLSPINGAIIKDNIIENTDFMPEYEMIVTGAPSNEIFTIENRATRANIDIDTTGLTTSGEVLNLIKTEMEALDFPDDPNPLLNIKYYDKVTVDEPVFASLITNELRAISLIPGTQGNQTQFEIVHDNAIATGVNIGAVDVIGNVVRITVRTSARANNAILVYNNGKSAAGADTILNLELAPGVPSDTGSQVSTTPISPTNLAGGVDSTRLTFYSRIPQGLTGITPALPGPGFGLDVQINLLPNAHNSVNRAGIIIRDQELVGSTTFTSGLGQMIIKDNIVRNNASLPRFEILYNGVEITNPMAYVDSDNSNNGATVVTLARTPFTGGTDSNDTTHLRTLAGLIVQGISLKARVAGTQGNNIHIAIEQPTIVDSPFRAIVSPLTTVSGYVIGGTEIRVLLPTDATGNPVNATVAELEKLLKTYLNQAILKIEDNILE